MVSRDEILLILGSMGGKLAFHPNPVVRALALRDLMGYGEDSPELGVLRGMIPFVPPVRDILEAQYPAGYWMRPDLGVSPKYRATVWQIIFLAQLGVGAIPEARHAVAAITRMNRDRKGALHLRRGSEGRSLALTAAVLWAVARLGLADGADWESSWRWVCARAAEGSYTLSAWLWVTMAATAWQREVPIRRPMSGGISFSRQLTFPLVLEADFLAYMQVSISGGYSDWLPENALDVLMEKRLPDGYWPLERVPGRLWCKIGEIGNASPWVTLRVLALLKAWLDRS